jgi:hypothetical protein
VGARAAVHACYSEMRRVAVHACGVITVLTVQSLTFAFALLHLFTAFAYFA